MQVERGPFFETNSSSTHSISLDKDTIPKLIDRLYASAGVCRLYTGQFGWTTERFTDSATKAAYALTWTKSFIEYKLDQLGLGTQEALEAMLVQVIQEHQPEIREVLFIPSADDGYPWGYIDHQSIEVFVRKDGTIHGGGPGATIFRDKETLKRFIFSPKSILYIGNDNE